MAMTAAQMYAALEAACSTVMVDKITTWLDTSENYMLDDAERFIGIDGMEAVVVSYNDMHCKTYEIDRSGPSLRFRLPGGADHVEPWDDMAHKAYGRYSALAFKVQTGQVVPLLCAYQPFGDASITFARNKLRALVSFATGEATARPKQCNFSGSMIVRQYTLV